MKKHIFAVVLLFAVTWSALAQQGREARRQQLEAQRVAFITKKLELTPKEAEIFWPIYNQYQEDKEATNKKYKHKKQLENMTDAELETHLLNTFKRDQEILDLKKAFFNEMKQKLSVRKLAMLTVAEKEFRTSILDVWRQKRRERQKRRQGMRNNN
ncbi:MAG: hypothetical protein AAF573_21465 [Bacteroidota bacterium]